LADVSHWDGLAEKGVERNLNNNEFFVRTPKGKRHIVLDEIPLLR